MTQTKPAEPLTRDQISSLLSEGEAASVSSAATNTHLRRGDEYLDLEHLERGVQRADGAVAELAQTLPRKAIHEDTWRRILRQLKQASLPRQP